MRKLLPYEHQLVESLGITKEQYLEFVAIQQEYKDPKAGTALDVRNADGGATVAIVLTIVGILFQVGAALLAPKPEIPDISGRRRRNREQRFAPTFGFNSTQELASYGDPVNLVYTNQNPNGDVRVAGSLVWSAVDNFGSTQLMRLMVVLGAGKIQKITYNKTAFGQTSLFDLDRQNVFIFEDKNLADGNSGPPPFSALNGNFADSDLFPVSLKPTNDDDPAFVIPALNGKKLGYSQAYTPTTSTSLGVYDVIPINVDVKGRDKDGDREEADIAIELRNVTGTANYKWRNDSGDGATFDVKDKIQLFFNNAGYKASDDAKQPAKQADNLRRQAVESLDFGSTYMLGSAKFRLQEISNPRSIENDEVKADFVCVESGQIPGTPYDEEDPVQENISLRKKFEKAKRILGAENEDFGDNLINVSNIVVGDAYKIVEIKNGFDFTTIGASKNERDTVFVATVAPTSPPSGNTVKNASIEEVELTNIGISFKDTQEVSWTPEYIASVSKNYDANNRRFTDADPDSRPDTRAVSYLTLRTKNIQRKGSILYTKDLLEDHLADKPTLKTNLLKKQINRQIKKLQRLIGKIESSKFFDGDKGTLLQCENDFLNGFKTNPPHNPAVDDVPVSVFRWDSTTFSSHAKNRATSRAESGDLANRHYTDVKVGNYYYFTFAYIDSSGRWNLFNFNGLQKAGILATDDDVFPNDARLNNLRSRLTEKERIFYNQKNKNRSLDKSTTKIKLDSVLQGSRFVLNRDTSYNQKGFEEAGDSGGSPDAAAKKRNTVSSKIEARIAKLFAERYQEAIEVIQKDIELLEQLRDEIITSEEDSEGKTGETDRVGTKAIKKAYRDIVKEKKKALGEIEEALSDWDGYSGSFDNNFFTKCLVKADTASYSTLSECNMVNFSFKTKLFRRISGRQKKYGEKGKMKEYSEADNGVKSRMVFFRMSYQQYQSNGELGSLNTVPYMFAIRHGSESDFYTQLSFYSSLENPTKWKFTFTPVYDILAEIRAQSFYSYIFLENSTNQNAVQVGNEHILWYGRSVDRGDFIKYYPDEPERGPIYTNEWDMFSVNSDTQTQFSFESGPEIQLTAVTEQQFGDITSNYENMSMMAVGIFAGRGLQDLRSISALVKHGKTCRRVEQLGTSETSDISSSYAPDIFVDTLLDKENGLGKYLTDSNLDKDSLKLAKDFCKNNKLPGSVQLFMDGLIADVGSWREFWIANAPFSLLELARKNGKDTLVPALPVSEDGAAADNAGLPVEVIISALFTTGNIIEGSYKEEFLNYGASTEDLIASVIYRDYTAKEVFSKNRSVEVQRTDASVSAVRETFDLSQFVTQREQAIMFGKLLCNQRKWIKKGIEFQTIPSQATVEPGDFIYVDVGLKHWDSYSSGVVMADGTLNAPLMQGQSNGTRNYNFLLYNKTNGTTEHKSNISVATSDKISKAASLASYSGWMFVMGNDKPSKRVYRVTEIAIEEEGEVAIKALEYPCFEENGKLRARIADFRASNFDVS